MLTKLNILNPHLHIKEVKDRSFEKFGKVLTGYKFSKLDKYMKECTSIPEKGNVYVASAKEIEEIEDGNLYEDLKSNFYGGMDIQIGYCNGNNNTLNALEYHKGSEINYAITNMVLLLGHISDIKENTYNSSKIEAYLVKKGQAVELYQTTLHFAPCKTSNEGFKCLVVLPRGTNIELVKRKKEREGEDNLLFMKNKWLLAHPSRENLIKKGAYPGIKGKNIEVFY